MVKSYRPSEARAIRLPSLCHSRFKNTFNDHHLPSTNAPISHRPIPPFTYSLNTSTLITG